MPSPPPAVDRFVYDGYDFDTIDGTLVCRYRLDDAVAFEERYTFGPDGDWNTAAVDRAARILFLLAGVSYYKTTAPAVVDLGATALTPLEADFLRSFYRLGLGEFAVVNDLPLIDIDLAGITDVEADPIDHRVDGLRPLVPFGGGLDSIVTVERLRPHVDHLELFVVSRPGDLFPAIRTAIDAAGLPVTQVGRQIDDKLMRSAELGYLNGHVPVTGILSAVAVVAAAGRGHDAVVMSNEWSASFGNMTVDGESINHQYSKSLDFETAFRQVLAAGIGPHPDYFSLLRSDSELRIAREFAELTGYHRRFRSCNRAFHLDPDRRLDHWCGECDKCAFIDLILSPFLERHDLESLFAPGVEPLDNPAMEPTFSTLIGEAALAKPFECVGDVNECRAALRLTADRTDRADATVVQALAGSLTPSVHDVDPASLLRPIGPNHIPPRYAHAARLD